MSGLANNSQNDPRRPDKVKRYKSSYTLQFADDQLQEYMNVIGMVFSMCGLMMKVRINLTIYITTNIIQLKFDFFKDKMVCMVKCIVLFCWFC
jgi:hypothetical protein